MHQLLLATRNHGKYLEFKQLMHRYVPTLKVLSLDDVWDILPPDCDENGSTFQENAKLKAYHYSKFLPDDVSLVIVAEDSGMEIQALGNQPGIHTRRWKGETMSDQEIIDYCLEKMQDLPNRDAAYVSSYYVLLPDGNSTCITEESRGVILKKAREESMLEGLPFRSLFYVPKLKNMFHVVREIDVDSRQGYRLGQEIAAQKIGEFLSV